MASRDVSVLSCIPLDQNDWQQRFSSRPCGDFVRFITETRFAGDAKRAWQFFRAEAAFSFFTATCRMASGRGWLPV